LNKLNNHSLYEKNS